MTQIVPFTPDNYQQIITTEQLAKEYKVPAQRLINNFNTHKGRFHEKKDYRFVEGDQLKALKDSLPPDEAATVDEIASQFNKRSARFYLWTKHGAFVHATLLDDDKAWEAYERRYVSSAQVQALLLAQQERIKQLSALIGKNMTIPPVPANTLGNVHADQFEMAVNRLRGLIKPFKEYVEKAQKKRAIYLSTEEGQQLMSALRAMHENLNTMYVESEHQQDLMTELDIRYMKQESIVKQITSALELPMPVELQALPEPD